MNGETQRILVISHGHPDLSLGGGEIAAYAQWRELRRRGIEAMFLARTDRPGHTGTSFLARSPDGLDLLFACPPVDHFKHSQPHRETVLSDFRALLERFRPTVVHFHHYVHLGLELIRVVRQYSADTVIALTLHEFLLMCHAQGQMLKTNGMLCHKATPFDCNGCFPDIAPQDFFMRELFIKSFIGLVDHFISPSRFLRDRYIAWGVPAERVTVIENGQPEPSEDGAASAGDSSLCTRFAVLGQMSRLKGTLLLLDAVRLLPSRIRELIRIEIHGSVQHQTESFTAEFERAMEGLGTTVRACGPYHPGDVQSIIRRHGWVIVPSIWWENSPLVIQEAFAARRPVICSNVGGMAEKVTAGRNGLHFRVGSATDLAARIEEAALGQELWETLQGGVPQPPVIAATVDEQLALFAERPHAPRRRAVTADAAVA